MNKAELIDAMAAQAGMSKKQAKEAVDAFVAVTSAALKKEGRLCLPGFVTMNVVNRGARVSRNVRTGEKIKVPAKKVVKFKADTALAEQVAGKKKK